MNARLIAMKIGIIIGAAIKMFIGVFLIGCAIAVVFAPHFMGFLFVTASVVATIITWSSVAGIVSGALMFLGIRRAEKSGKING